jgi:hypothetical protein
MFMQVLLAPTKLHFCICYTFIVLTLIGNFFTLTPRLSALWIVSLLSCLGGPNNDNKPTNCYGALELSFVL